MTTSGMMPEEPTTPDLVELFQRFREALNRGNLDAVVAMYAPDAVWDVSLPGLEGVFEGREAIRGAYQDLIAPYDDLEFVAEETRDLGSGVALNVFLARGRLRGSTRFVESRGASVSTWGNGLIARFTQYLEIDEVRAAAERLAEERGKTVSEENVARYVRSVDAWNRGALDEWLEGTVTPGWELVTGGTFPDLAPIYRGREGALEMWNALRGFWDEQSLRIAIERIEDLGDTVLALLTLRASGESSGITVATKWAHVITYSMGDEHIRSYATWDDGLKAVALE